MSDHSDDEGDGVANNDERADLIGNLAKMDPMDVFKEFDTDGSGLISFEEVSRRIFTHT